MNIPFSITSQVVQWDVIKTLPSETFWIIFACLFIFLLMSIFQSYKATVKARDMEDTPCSKIRSAAQGWVVLEGEQHFYAGIPLIAPLSKTACTWYYYTVECYKKDGWERVDKGNSESLLMLNDGTGECIIDPQGATITPNKVDTWRGFNSHPNGKPKSWIGRLWGSFGRYRYCEYRMEDGDFLYAMGYFQTINLSDAPDMIRNTYKSTNNENSLNLLTQFTASARQPYVLSSQNQKRTINKIRRDAIIWSVAYLMLFIVLSLALLIRLS